MNCKKCKHCKRYISSLTLAYGGFVYKCNLGKGERGVVGHYDSINNKEHWKEYKTKECFDYEKQKEFVWTSKQEGELSFQLENNDFLIKGGSRHTSQMIDKTWCEIRKKGKLGKLYYLNSDYNGVIATELENEIIMIIEENFL